LNDLAQSLGRSVEGSASAMHILGTYCAGDGVQPDAYGKSARNALENGHGSSKAP